MPHDHKEVLAANLQDIRLALEVSRIPTEELTDDELAGIAQRASEIFCSLIDSTNPEADTLSQAQLAETILGGHVALYWLRTNVTDKVFWAENDVETE